MDKIWEDLASGIPNYENRPGQQEMARAVASALEWKQPLLVEAGTGTGKTLAYLLPAALAGKKTVISTATLALQEQLLEKDIPTVRKVLGRPLRVANLKGISNYLCRRKMRQLNVFDSVNANGKLQSWLLKTETGEISEFTDIPANSREWASYTTTADSRIGPRCTEFEKCFVTSARRAAERADIIVVNHHLFFSDLALRESHRGAQVLPEYEAVVFDEAHHLPNTVTQLFGRTVSLPWLLSIAQECRSNGGLHGDTFANKIENAGKDLFFRLQQGIPALESPGETRLPSAILRERAEDAWHKLDSALENVTIELSGASEPPSWEATSLIDKAEAARSSLAVFGDPTPKRYTTWAENKSGSLRLHCTPIDSGHILRKELLSQTPTVIFTSATLSTDQSFAYSRTNLGLIPEQAEEIRVPSPFDYKNQSILYLPRDLPEPSHPAFGAASAERIRELLEISQGRAFLLFTSYRAMLECRDCLADLPYQLLIQGEATKHDLVHRFRENESSVLLGTNTFWEGVDVPGPALSLVVIQKLPFEPPTRPIVEAKIEALLEAEEDPFQAYQLPTATIRLRQGLGRLIRTQTDRGILCVLDKRVVTKRYSSELLCSLPESLPRTSALELVRRFWRK